MLVDSDVLIYAVDEPFTGDHGARTRLWRPLSTDRRE